MISLREPAVPVSLRFGRSDPKMIAEVAFTEWTSDGSIRHPSFQGLREDKNPKDVVREQPAAGRGKAKNRSKRSR